MEIPEGFAQKKAAFEELIASAAEKGERHAQELSYVDLFRTISEMNKMQAKNLKERNEQLYRFCEKLRLQKLTEAEKMNMVKIDLFAELGELEKVSPYYEDALSNYLQHWYKGLLKVVSPVKQWLNERHILIR